MGVSMRKGIAILLALSMLFCLSACEADKTQASGNNQQNNIQEIFSEKENTETSEETFMPIQPTESKVLIAYFTWADNTDVNDKEAAVQSALSHYKSVGDTTDYEKMDATTSASLLPPGNTAQMAEWIQQRIGGDLFSIIVTEPYSSDYEECLDRAADEKAANARPKLAEHIDNIDNYDVIFLGFPNWWYTAPMAVFSFLEEYDLSGKTIVPFCAHGTGGIAGSVKDIIAALPDSAKVLEPIGIYRSEINSAQPMINEWLDNLGFVSSETNFENGR